MIYISAINKIGVGPPFGMADDGWKWVELAIHRALLHLFVGLGRGAFGHLGPAYPSLWRRGGCWAGLELTQWECCVASVGWLAKANVHGAETNTKHKGYQRVMVIVIIRIGIMIIVKTKNNSFVDNYLFGKDDAIRFATSHEYSKSFLIKTFWKIKE